jgi:WD40 repeat protein
MRFSAYQEKFLYADFKCCLKLMSLPGLKTIKDFGEIHDDNINGLVFTADEKFFFSSSWDGGLKQWNYKDQTLVKDYRKMTYGIRCLYL